MAKVTIEIRLDSSSLDAAIKKLERLKELQKESLTMPGCGAEEFASRLADKITEETARCCAPDLDAGYIH